MIAALYRKYTPGIRELTLFYILNPGAIDADRKVVFLLAGNRTCMASDAFAIVDDKSVIHIKEENRQDAKASGSKKKLLYLILLV